ncbi:hypothetical protein SLE2022_120510 [Rubroshorea leprosula]
MIQLFLSKSNWEKGGDSEASKLIISLLHELGSVIWSLIISGGRSEARLWLCNAVSCISCISPHQQQRLFVSLLTSKPPRKRLASQLLQIIFQKRPQYVGSILAKKSYMLEKFFQGNPRRIMQWFSNFGDGDSLEHKKGAKALSQFAFVNRDLCWEELEWKGKHGQSPAVVATKPHYFLDLDVQRTVENFLEYVPEFWSSNEFADSLKDGEILFTDTKFFVELFVDLMYKEDSRDVWEVINEFLEEESFSSLCHHLLITLEEGDLIIFLKLLQKYVNPRMEPKGLGNSSFWMEFILYKFYDFESFDQLLLLNAIINQRRQLLWLVRDEECQEECSTVKDLVSQICKASSDAKSLAPVLKECFEKRNTDVIKLLGLYSWVIYCKLSEKCDSAECWESLFASNGIKFHRSDKYSLLHHNGSFDESESEFDDRPSVRHRKRNKSRKKRRRDFDNEGSFVKELLAFDTSYGKLGSPSETGSWLLSTDDFSTSWTNVDLPEHISQHCLSTWMNWLVPKWKNMA